MVKVPIVVCIILYISNIYPLNLPHTVKQKVRWSMSPYLHEISHGPFKFFIKEDQDRLRVYLLYCYNCIEYKVLEKGLKNNQDYKIDHIIMEDNKYKAGIYIGIRPNKYDREVVITFKDQNNAQSQDSFKGDSDDKM